MQNDIGIIILYDGRRTGVGRGVLRSVGDGIAVNQGKLIEAWMRDDVAVSCVAWRDSTFDVVRGEVVVGRATALGTLFEFVVARFEQVFYDYLLHHSLTLVGCHIVFGLRADVANPVKPFGLIHALVLPSAGGIVILLVAHNLPRHGLLHAGSGGICAEALHGIGAAVGTVVGGRCGGTCHCKTVVPVAGGIA